MRSRRLFWDALSTLPVGYWAGGVGWTQLSRLLLVRKLLRYVASLTSGRDAEAHLLSLIHI